MEIGPILPAKGQVCGAISQCDTTTLETESMRAKKMARNEAYREAEQKIEEARRAGATKLDLSSSYSAPDEKKLTELPESLWELTQLQTLNLK
ncbi:MAG: hypothetical protein KC419_21040, partial [Anaerolineales bacterium]|nr:hypothetical protein [Anaerolineales bacterium]